MPRPPHSFNESRIKLCIHVYSIHPTSPHFHEPAMFNLELTFLHLTRIPRAPPSKKPILGCMCVCTTSDALHGLLPRQIRMSGYSPGYRTRAGTITLSPRGPFLPALLGPLQRFSAEQRSGHNNRNHLVVFHASGLRPPGW